MMAELKLRLRSQATQIGDTKQSSSAPPRVAKDAPEPLFHSPRFPDGICGPYALLLRPANPSTAAAGNIRGSKPDALVWA
jgi:hypothetical protein